MLSRRIRWLIVSTAVSTVLSEVIKLLVHSLELTSNVPYLEPG